MLRTFKGAAPRHAIDDFALLGKSFERHANHIDMQFVPKRHYTWHIATQCIRLGSLPAAANWRDEQINGYLKAVAMAAHRMIWHRRVLGEFRRAFGVAKIWCATRF
eukprot:8686408-Pyramimonas_sp.AAC.1